MKFKLINHCLVALVCLTNMSVYAAQRSFEVTITEGRNESTSYPIQGSRELRFGGLGAIVEGLTFEQTLQVLSQGASPSINTPGWPGFMTFDQKKVVLTNQYGREIEAHFRFKQALFATSYYVYDGRYSMLGENSSFYGGVVLDGSNAFYRFKPQEATSLSKVVVHVGERFSNENEVYPSPNSDYMNLHDILYELVLPPLTDVYGGEYVGNVDVTYCAIFNLCDMALNGGGVTSSLTSPAFVTDTFNLKVIVPEKYGMKVNGGMTPKVTLYDEDRVYLTTGRAPKKLVGRLPMQYVGNIETKVSLTCEYVNITGCMIFTGDEEEWMEVDTTMQLPNTHEFPNGTQLFKLPASRVTPKPTIIKPRGDGHWDSYGSGYLIFETTEYKDLSRIYHDYSGQSFSGRIDITIEPNFN